MATKQEEKPIEFRKKITAQFQIRSIMKIAKAWGMDHKDTLWCLLTKSIAAECEKINSEKEDGI